jgi:hypothetical protein
MTTQEICDIIKGGLISDQGVKAYNRSLWAVSEKIRRIAGDEGVSSSPLTDAERRDLLVLFFDDKLRAKELTAQEVDRYMTLCGLDKKSQDITVNIVEFRPGLWDEAVSDEGVGEPVEVIDEE